MAERGPVLADITDPVQEGGLTASTDLTRKMLPSWACGSSRRRSRRLGAV
jgi:hypothetical protein